MKLSQKQANLIKDINSVLKRYSSDDYNPDVVIEVLSRSLRKNKKGQGNLKIANTSPIPKALPHEILKEQRIRLGLTMQVLAKKTGIAQPNLSAMENGKRPIGIATAKRLAKSLGIDYHALL